jgi:hypothetical protein
MTDECYKYLALVMDRIKDAECTPLKEMVEPAFYMAKQFALTAESKCAIKLEETLKDIERGLSAAKRGDWKEAGIAAAIARLNFLKEVAGEK